MKKFLPSSFICLSFSPSPAAWPRGGRAPAAIGRDGEPQLCQRHEICRRLSSVRPCRGAALRCPPPARRPAQPSADASVSALLYSTVPSTPSRLPPGPVVAFLFPSRVVSCPARVLLVCPGAPSVSRRPVSASRFFAFRFFPFSLFPFLPFFLFPFFPAFPALPCPPPPPRRRALERD